MKTIRTNLLKDLNGNQLTVMIFYNEGRFFTKEALYRFLKGMGYSPISKKFNYSIGHSVFEEVYAPGHLDEYEICVVEVGNNRHTIRFCPDYFLLEEEVE